MTDTEQALYVIVVWVNETQKNSLENSFLCPLLTLFFFMNDGLRSRVALNPSWGILWQQTTVTVCFQDARKSPTVILDFSFLD